MPDAVMTVTVADFRDYATSIGVTLPESDAACMVLLIKASGYLDSRDDELRGIRTERDQEYAYPRKDLFINGFKFRDDEIPDIAKRCLMALAIDAVTVDLFASSIDLPVISEEVSGAVRVQYATPINVEVSERRSNGMALLSQLLMSRSLSIPLQRT